MLFWKDDIDFDTVPLDIELRPDIDFQPYLVLPQLNRLYRDFHQIRPAYNRSIIDRIATTAFMLFAKVGINDPVNNTEYNPFVLEYIKRKFADTEMATILLGINEFRLSGAYNLLRITVKPSTGEI